MKDTRFDELNLDDLDLNKREELLLKYFSIEHEDDWYAVLLKSTKSEIEEVIEHLNHIKTAEAHELQMALKGMLEYLRD